MIVVDTSAWIEFFDGTESGVDRTVARLLEADEEIALTEVVAMELLAGARSRRELAELRAHVFAFSVLPLGGLAGFEAAAALFRACRDRGETVRNLPDCLVAAAAIEAGAPILHSDADFDKLARHTPLEVFAPDE